MLITVVLPFCDFRPLVQPDFKRLPKPVWPSPDAGHLRGIGGVQPRSRSGFDTWVGERSLVVGLPGAKIQLPRAIAMDPKRHVALIRKACHFDGLLNGRFEFLFRIKEEPSCIGDLSTIARWLLERPVTLKSTKANSQPLQKTLGRAGPALAAMWAKATVSTRRVTKTQGVRAGRAMVFSESNACLGKADPDAPWGSTLIIEQTARPFEHFVVYPPDDVDVTIRHYRANSRYFRTYIMRMLQDVEAMSQMCDFEGVDLDDDRAQLIFNEYTRHISRSSQQVQSSAQIVEYCYAALDRLYPGKIEDLRPRIINSNIRPNVRKKFLELLDAAMDAVKDNRNIFVIEGDFVLGDKFENVTATGDGIAIGRGATATSQKIGNVQGADLGAALRDWAAKVRQSDNDDASVEAECLEHAAEKAEKGDEKGVVSYLGKAGGWVFDIAKTVGSATLEAYLKSHLGLGG